MLDLVQKNGKGGEKTRSEEHFDAKKYYPENPIFSFICKS